MGHPPTDGPGPKLKYLNRPDVAETYADSLETVSFDGMSVRMELVVNRFEPAEAGAIPSGSKVTAARLVLPIAGVVQMLSQLNGLMSALQQQGALSGVTLVHTQRGVH